MGGRCVASAWLILFAELSNFQSDDATLQVAGPLSTRIDFTLTPSFASDVTVIAEVPMLDTSDNVSRIALAPEQVSVLPSLGERDLFRAFQLLPGVSGSNEASSGLYVRSGTRTAPSTSATCGIPATPGSDSSGRGSGGRTCSARSRSAIRVSKTSRDRSRQVGSNATPSAEGNQVDDVTFRAAVPITLGVGHTLEGGVEVTENNLSYNLESGPGPGARAGANPLTGVLNRAERGRMAAAFLQDRWLLGSRLLLVPGIRLTSFDRTGERYTEPRLAGTLFLTDAFKLKTAAGRYFQFTNRITREDVLQGNREFWSLSDGTTVPVAEATHLIGGTSCQRGDLLVDFELFTKDLSNLTQFAPRFAAASEDLDYDAFFYHGTGTARGSELLVQKRSGRHTGWVSYTLSKVEESFPQLA